MSSGPLCPGFLDAVYLRYGLLMEPYPNVTSSPEHSPVLTESWRNYSLSFLVGCHALSLYHHRIVIRGPPLFEVTSPLPTPTTC